MTKKIQEYFEGIGRRKESIARVRIIKGEKAGYVINDKKAEIFFPVKEFQNALFQPLVVVGLEKKLFISVKVSGGGLRGQSDAIKLGLSRALVKYDNNLHQVLKDQDLLKRDARKKERKKPGLKKARRSAQWRKR